MALANPTMEALKFALFDGRAEGLSFNLAGFNSPKLASA